RARHLEEGRLELPRDLVVQPLELHRRAAGDGLPDIDPLEVELPVDRFEGERRRIGVEDGDPVLVEASRELWAFQQAEPAVDARPGAAHVALLAGDLRGPRTRCET